MNVHQTYIERMSDAELIAARDHAQTMAHGAPKSENGQSTAWARWSAEWSRLTEEASRRGIGEPAYPKPLIRRGEGEPASDPGLQAGSPIPQTEYATVPKEPTAEMLRAGKGALYRFITSLPEDERKKYRGKDGGLRIPQSLKMTLRWRAMVEAAAVSIQERGTDG